MFMDLIILKNVGLVMSCGSLVHVQDLTTTTTLAAGIVSVDFCFFLELRLMASRHLSLGIVTGGGRVAAASLVELDVVGSWPSHLILPWLLLLLPEPKLWKWVLTLL